MDASVVSLLIVAAALVLFVTEVIPLAATAVLAALAMAVFGVVPFSDAFSGFGYDTVYLMIGMMVVGNALFETGVAALVGQRIVAFSGRREWLFLTAIMVVTAVLSGFLNNTATMAMMIPVASAAILASGGLLSKKRTYMAMGVVATVGGLLTVIGSPPQLIAEGLLIDGEYGTLGFFDIAIFGVPLVLLTLAYFLTLGRWLQRRFIADDGVPAPGDARSDADLLSPAVPLSAPVPVSPAGLLPSTDPLSSANPPSPAARIDPADPLSLADHLSLSGPGSRGPSGPGRALTRVERGRQWIVLGVLALCVAGFMADVWSLGVIAMLGAVVCVATGCITQQRVFETLDWTTVVIMACSFGISAGLDQSGGGMLVADWVIGALGDRITPWLLVASFALIGAVLSNFMSNTGAAALLLPIGIAAASSQGYNVTVFAMVIAVAASIGFLTPVATPPMTMSLAAGYHFSDYLKVGAPLNLLAFLMVIGIAALIL